MQADNLLALKALLPYYAGQVKCIYIDPPYNTGNEGWVYNDNVNSPEMKAWLGKAVGKEAEDLTRHDKWLCMMYPRLALLRDFLCEDGAIFISIDDNEVASLRMIMDEIFGPQNFITTIIWQKNFSTKNSAKHLSESHDYIVLYAKNKHIWQPNLIPRQEKQDARYKNPDNDPRGPWTSGDLSARNYYSLGTYPIQCPSGRIIEGPPKGTYWRVSRENFEKLNKENRIWWGKDGGNVPRLKRFLSEVKDGVVPDTIWFNNEVGNTQDAKKELLASCHFQDSRSVFITPKPLNLIKRILEISTNKDSIILDSFSGSGTTGHAIFEQNKIDGGKRRFILIEMQEDICKAVTSQRVNNIASQNNSGVSYCELGSPLFDETGQIRAEVTFHDLARHVFFTETGNPLPENAEKNFPLLGISNGVAVYLLYNGVLKDKRPDSGNVLTVPVLHDLPPHDGPKVIYGVGCRIGAARLAQEGITFHQIPYAIKVS